MAYPEICPSDQTVRRRGIAADLTVLAAELRDCTEQTHAEIDVLRDELRNSKADAVQMRHIVKKIGAATESSTRNRYIT